MTARTTAPDRAEISRRNGRKSRGLASPEGKARSRMNALKHGLSARIPVLPGEDEAAFRRRVDDFVDALAPRNAVEVALAEEAALATWRIVRAERAEAARVAAALRAAEACAGLETQDEVSALGYWLLAENLRVRQEAGKCLFPFLSEDRHEVFRCGDGDPRHVVLLLEATADGCLWLREQWDRLGARLERGEDWQTHELIVALQLRGKRPMGMDAINWDDLLDPSAAGGKPEVIARATRLMLLQWDERLPDDPAGRRAALLRLVREETARLQQREAGHRRREAADRDDLADRLGVDLTAEGERMRRYHVDCDRKLHRAIESLLKLRRGEGVGIGDEPAPDGSPDAEPEPVGTVDGQSDPVDGPAGEAGAEVDRESEGDNPEDDEPLAGGHRSSFGRVPSSILEPGGRSPSVAFAAAEPASTGISAPARPAGEPESDPAAQNEPGTPADCKQVPRNEPGSPADDRTAQNEPGPQGSGDPVSREEPGGSLGIADRSLPAMVCAVVLLLAAAVTARVAGPGSWGFIEGCSISQGQGAVPKPLASAGFLGV
jgi:hypothetical protein